MKISNDFAPLAMNSLLHCAVVIGAFDSMDSTTIKYRISNAYFWWFSHLNQAHRNGDIHGFVEVQEIVGTFRPHIVAAPQGVERHASTDSIKW